MNCNFFFLRLKATNGELNEKNAQLLKHIDTLGKKLKFQKDSSILLEREIRKMALDSENITTLVEDSSQSEANEPNTPKKCISLRNEVLESITNNKPSTFNSDENSRPARTVFDFKISSNINLMLKKIDTKFDFLRLDHSKNELYLINRSGEVLKSDLQYFSKISNKNYCKISTKGNNNKISSCHLSSNNQIIASGYEHGQLSISRIIPNDQDSTKLILETLSNNAHSHSGNQNNIA